MLNSQNLTKISKNVINQEGLSVDFVVHQGGWYVKKIAKLSEERKA